MSKAILYRDMKTPSGAMKNYLWVNMRDEMTHIVRLEDEQSRTSHRIH